MKVLLTCGLGDFIALEAYLTYRETSAVDTIYWATRARELIMPLIPFVFPNVKQHIIVRDEWGPAHSETFCVESRAELPGLDPSAVDLSVQGIALEVKHGSRRFRSSALVKQQLADISHFNLPERYVVVHPYSENVRTTERDMTAEEWDVIYDSLKPSGTPIVVVNKGTERLEAYRNVIDLTNKLTILEALEVVKHSTYFIGASSAFSVIAAKVLGPKQLFIKGHKLLRDEFAWFYYAPHEDDHFDARSLVMPNFIRELPKLKRIAQPREVTVNTVQGIGDIFWVYQKLAPYFDKINLNILCTKLLQVQQRAKTFCRMLPKVGEVTFTVIPGPTYEAVAQSTYKLSEVLSRYDSFINGELMVPTDTPELDKLGLTSEVPTCNYSVNAPLEKGVRIDEIDPDAKLETFVDLGLPATVWVEDYVCVFVAGAKNDKLWTPETWVKLIGKVCKGKPKIVLIGAEWDKLVQAEVEERLLKAGYEVDNQVAKLALADSIDVIRRSKFFIGYQSGLNIIADNYDVPQLMLYFEELKPMMYAWCKRSNMETKFFAATFDEDLDLIVSRVGVR